MKKLLILLALVPCLAIAQPKQKPGVVYDAVITRVIDGDTVGIAATWLPAPLKPELGIHQTTDCQQSKATDCADGLGQVWWACTG